MWFFVPREDTGGAYDESGVPGTTVEVSFISKIINTDGKKKENIWEATWV